MTILVVVVVGIFSHLISGGGSQLPYKHTVLKCSWCLLPVSATYPSLQETLKPLKKSTIEYEWIDYSVSVERWNQGLLRDKCCKVLGWLHMVTYITFFQWCLVKVCIYHWLCQRKQPKFTECIYARWNYFELLFKKTTYKFYEQTIQANWGAFV